jgi:CheY-like chemotaxis protein
MEKKRILLIDDEDTISHICAMVLESSGRFFVRTISSGTAALATARILSPHLIILDRYLTDGHGLDIAAEFQADAELCNVPIVFLTGSLTKEEARKSLGGFPALSKPISGPELVESALRLAA